MPEQTLIFEDEYDRDAGFFPEALRFHLPGPDSPVELNHEEPEYLHRQLVTWCLCQRYRYYVLDSPVVSDADYDYIEDKIKELEDEYSLNNKYSPTKKIGSTRREDYPPTIRYWFKGIKRCQKN